MLNSKQMGKAIAINDKAKLLYIDDDFTKDKNEVEMNETMILPPIDKGEREVVFIAGPSGVGKSTIAKKYIQAYKKLHKKNDVYIFSKVTDDKTLKDLKAIYRIPINDDLVKNPIDHTEFENSLILFDDIDTISNKNHAAALTQLMSDVLEIGRHNNISVIITSHLINPQDKKRGRMILNESHRVIIFPRSTTAHAVNYFLKDYIGIGEKALVQKIINLPTRWVCISKHFPMYCLYKDGAFCI